MKCEYCENQFEPKAMGDLTCSDCGPEPAEPVSVEPKCECGRSEEEHFQHHYRCNVYRPPTTEPAESEPVYCLCGHFRDQFHDGGSESCCYIHPQTGSDCGCGGYRPDSPATPPAESVEDEQSEHFVDAKDAWIPSQTKALEDAIMYLSDCDYDFPKEFTKAELGTMLQQYATKLLAERDEADKERDKQTIAAFIEAVIAEATEAGRPEGASYWLYLEPAMRLVARDFGVEVEI